MLRDHLFSTTRTYCHSAIVCAGSSWFLVKLAGKGEPTSGLEPLSCSLRVRSQAFTAVSRYFINRLHKPCLPVLGFLMFPEGRSGYCHSYCQNAQLGYPI